MKVISVDLEVDAVILRVPKLELTQECCKNTVGSRKEVVYCVLYSISTESSIFQEWISFEFRDLRKVGSVGTAWMSSGDGFELQSCTVSNLTSVESAEAIMSRRHGTVLA